MSREIDQEGTVVIKIHPDESDQEFPCDMCKNVFTEMSSLELHIASEHLKQFSFGSSEASNVHKQSNLIEHLNKQDENNFEVKTLFQTDQVDNTDEYEFDRDKFEHDDENKELGDYNKIKSDVKTILEMDQMEIDHVDTIEQDINENATDEDDDDIFQDLGESTDFSNFNLSEDENNEKLSSSNENNSEVKTIIQIDQVDNIDKDEPDQDKFEQDDENKELGDDFKIIPDVKIILEMDQKPKKDFGKYSKKQLKAIGVLVQVRTYKNPTELPLKNDKTIQIKAGQKVCFYKFGLLIHLITEGM